MCVPPTDKLSTRGSSDRRPIYFEQMVEGSYGAQ